MGKGPELNITLAVALVTPLAYSNYANTTRHFTCSVLSLPSLTMVQLESFHLPSCGDVLVVVAMVGVTRANEFMSPLHNYEQWLIPIRTGGNGRLLGIAMAITRLLVGQPSLRHNITPTTIRRTTITNRNGLHLFLLFLVFPESRIPTVALYLKLIANAKLLHPRLSALPIF